jgi:hypothetical protein
LLYVKGIIAAVFEVKKEIPSRILHGKTLTTAASEE